MRISIGADSGNPNKEVASGDLASGKVAISYQTGVLRYLSAIRLECSGDENDC